MVGRGKERKERVREVVIEGRSGGSNKRKERGMEGACLLPPCG